MAIHKGWKLAGWLAGLVAAVLAFEGASELLPIPDLRPRDLFRLGSLAVVLLLGLVPASYLVASGKVVVCGGKMQMSPTCRIPPT